MIAGARVLRDGLFCLARSVAAETMTGKPVWRRRGTQTYGDQGESSDLISHYIVVTTGSPACPVIQTGRTHSLTNLLFHSPFPPAIPVDF